MAQLVEALRYKSEGRGFDSRWCHWKFSFLRPHYAHGIDSASKRNEYQEYFLGGKGGWCVGLTTLLLSCADCLEIWEPQTAGTLRACPGLKWDCFTFTFTFTPLLIGRCWCRDFVLPYVIKFACSVCFTQKLQLFFDAICTVQWGIIYFIRSIPCWWNQVHGHVSRSECRTKSQYKEW